MDLKSNYLGLLTERKWCFDFCRHWCQTQGYPKIIAVGCRSARRVTCITLDSELTQTKCVLNSGKCIVLHLEGAMSLQSNDSGKECSIKTAMQLKRNLLFSIVAKVLSIPIDL